MLFCPSDLGSNLARSASGSEQLFMHPAKQCTSQLTLGNFELTQALFLRHLL